MLLRARRALALIVSVAGVVAGLLLVVVAEGDAQRIALGERDLRMLVRLFHRCFIASRYS